MASNENERVPGGQATGLSAEEVIESVRADLAAIDALVFRGTGSISLDERLAEVRAAVVQMFAVSGG